MLYNVAMQTGLRASELASLTPESFNLYGIPPIVTVEPGYTKNKEPAEQPLPFDLVEVLASYLDAKQDSRKEDQHVWPGTWFERAADMIRDDLAATTAAMQKADPKSPGIPYETKDGVIDFHALRHTFITLLVKSGVQPKKAQTLARHSTITLTMDRYAHRTAGRCRCPGGIPIAREAEAGQAGDRHRRLEISLQTCELPCGRIRACESCSSAGTSGPRSYSWLDWLSSPHLSTSNRVPVCQTKPNIGPNGTIYVAINSLPE
jgi:hypothetical protein